MRASLPFHPIRPRPRRPLLGAVIIALSYAVPLVTYVGVMAYGYRTTIGNPNASPSAMLDTATLVQNGALALGLIGMLAASPRAAKYGAGLRQQDAIKRIETDGRPPVLYLRSFGDDAAPDYTGSLVPFGAEQTVEMRLARALGRVGPMISIGRPGERLPEIGSNRFYVSDGEWQQAVRHFLETAAAVVIVVGRSTGVTWEIRTALDKVPRERLLLAFPHLLTAEQRTWKLRSREWLRSTTSRGRHTLGKTLMNALRAEREARYESFRTSFGDTFGGELPPTLGTSVFLDCLHDGLPRLLPARQPLFVRRERDRQGVTIDYARSLRPFVEKLKSRTIEPDRIERLLTSRRALRILIVLSVFVAMAAFVSPFIFRFAPIGIVLFFLMPVPASFAYWGVWNLVRETPGSAPVDTPRFVPAPHALVVRAQLTYIMLALGLLFGIPGIIALGIAYWARREVTGTFLESHVRWQIRTCWSALGLFVMAVLLAATVFLALFGILTMLAAYIWVGYRVVRGWRALGNRAAVSPSRSILA